MKFKTKTGFGSLLTGYPEVLLRAGDGHSGGQGAGRSANIGPGAQINAALQLVRRGAAGPIDSYIVAKPRDRPDRQWWNSDERDAGDVQLRVTHQGAVPCLGVDRHKLTRKIVGCLPNSVNDAGFRMLR